MLKVRSVMTPTPRTVRADTSIAAALAIIEDTGVRHLPVLDGERVVGIVSDRDLRAWRQALLDQRAGEGGSVSGLLRAQPVAGRMTPEMVTVEADAPLSESVSRLRDLGCGALPVLERGRLVGMLSAVDVIGLIEALLLEVPDAGTPFEPSKP